MSTIEVYDKQYKNLADVDWNFPNSRSDALSNIHPYPARFINDIPKTLIELISCPDNTVVLDPFCGSGTTLVEAQRHGIPSIGIDLNPIACLISKVKTSILADSFLPVLERITDTAQEVYAENIPIPVIPNLDHWFEKEIQKALSALLYLIQQEEDSNIKDALRLVLSSIIVRVSNQESDTRYAAVTKKYEANDVFTNFLNAGRKLNQAKQGFLYQKDVRVITQDILTVKSSQIGQNVGLIITSPPYPNAYEYWLYHKYRMWWLGYDPIEVRTYEIGCRPHYQKKNGQTERDFYKQMNSVFQLISSCLVIGGHICFVVGRSIISGRVVDNQILIKDIGAKNGLSLVANITRNIATSKKSFNLKYGKIKEENILVFKKEK